MNNTLFKFKCMDMPPRLHNHDCDLLTRAMYWPFIGFFYRHRFQMALDMINLPVTSVLEIGYGAGFLAYTLAPKVKYYTGIDIHDKPQDVAEALRKNGIHNVTLRVADVRNLTSIPEGSFDLVVAVSCLEHIAEHMLVQRQIVKVLRKGGQAVYGIPNKNILTRVFFNTLGYDDNLIHPTDYHNVLDSAKSAGLLLDAEKIFPGWVGRHFSFYWVGRFIK